VKTHFSNLFAQADRRSLADAVQLALALRSCGRTGRDGSQHPGQHGHGEAEHQGGEAEQRAVQHQNDTVGAAGSLHGVLLVALWLCRPGWTLAAPAGHGSEPPRTVAGNPQVNTLLLGFAPNAAERARS
jgi:hypothetical protein